MGALAWDSLRWRLPLLIAAVIVAVVSTFLGFAYREVEANLLETAGARARGAADQIAGLLAQSTQQRLNELQQAAAHAAVREYLLHPTEEGERAARARLSALKSPNPQMVDLWNAAGEKVLSVANSPAAETTLPSESSAPTAAHVSRLQLYRDTLLTETAIGVESGTTTGAGAPRAGFLVVRRPAFTASSTGEADTLNRLVGNSASVRLGNYAGDGWTDMSKIVPAPPIDLVRSGLAAYRSADGDRRRGAIAKIAGTPWAVWVEFPDSSVLAPARSSLKRMIAIAVIVVLVAGVVVRLMTGAITTPLSQLTHASEAMAGGEYSRRVDIDRRDEIGRLGVAFNAMAERVEHSHRELEERVNQRVQELKASREELDHFFALTPDMLCIADMDGRFKRVNAAWRETLGWADEDLTAVPYLDFVHPDEREATQARSASLADGDLTLAFENRYRCKDGSYKWLSWRAAPMVSRGLVYAAARDVTVEKQTARELENRATELGAVNRELEAFSYSVSHDLRAPLRHIGGFATMLKESVSLNAEGERMLKTIIDSAIRMGDLIDDLLAFSRVGRSQLERSEVDLGLLVGDIQQEVMTGANGQQVVWRVHPLPSVQADRSLLRLAFVNLLSNALKYSASRAPAEIEIGTLAVNGDETVLFVRDNGVGFDMQYAHKLFGVFQRLHSSEEFEGTGIGLANVKRIVHRHGGRVWAESAIDHGATFYVALPLESHA
jgi:PAS domain S-box-containing protein